MKLFNWIYKLLGVEYGKNLRLKGLPVLVTRRRGGIKMGSDVSINSSFRSNLIGLYQRTIIVARTPEAQVVIGDDVGISGATIYARERIEIGSHTRIGANVKIIDNDFHPVDPELRLKASNQNMGVKPVVIGKNVFIGTNSIILKGTTIGDNTTIGAGSVVHGSIPSNCVAAGNPAKVIKEIHGGGKLIAIFTSFYAYLQESMADRSGKGMTIQYV